MNRTEIINSLIKKYNYKWYLEIGVQNGVNFNAIECDNKIGVDPVSGGTFHGTSDDFFKTNERYFDIIFIDGLHQATQVYKDIENALKILTKGGIIILHDMIPMNKESQILPREQKIWNGDCWMAFVWLRATREDLLMFTVDTDCGCGVIVKGYPKHPAMDINCNITYENFDIHKRKWLNLKTIEEFKEWLLTS